MDENSIADVEQGDRRREIMSELKSLLEAERAALREGRADSVARLAMAKEKAASSLEALVNRSPREGSTDRELREIAVNIAKLAESNHLLLRQMYQHYQGMLELLLKLAGEGSTYDRNGLLGAARRPAIRSRIMA